MTSNSSRHRLQCSSVTVHSPDKVDQPVLGTTDYLPPTSRGESHTKDWHDYKSEAGSDAGIHGATHWQEYISTFQMQLLQSPA